MSPKDKIKQIDKKMTLVGLYDAPGVIMLGLALHAKFSANSQPVLDMLNNPDVVNLFLVIGGLIIVWGGSRVFTLSCEKAKLLKATNLKHDS